MEYHLVAVDDDLKVEKHQIAVSNRSPTINPPASATREPTDKPLTSVLKSSPETKDNVIRIASR